MNWQVLRRAGDNPIQEVTAAGGVVTSFGGAGWAWLSHANDILQFVVLIIAIASGVASYRYYSRKRKEMDQ